MIEQETEIQETPTSSVDNNPGMETIMNINVTLSIQVGNTKNEIKRSYETK